MVGYPLKWYEVIRPLQTAFYNPHHILIDTTTMRLTQFPINTHKEVPADAEIISHQLMLRAGMIRKLASGLYTWLPLGLRVLRKVCLLYTSPSPRDLSTSRMPSSA